MFPRVIKMWITFQSNPISSTSTLLLLLVDLMSGVYLASLAQGQSRVTYDMSAFVRDRHHQSARCEQTGNATADHQRGYVPLFVLHFSRSLGH